MTKTITGLTVTTSAAAGDFIPIWRLANGDTRKITKANLLGGTMTGAGVVATGGFTLTVAAASTINGSLVGNMTGGGTIATGGFTLSLSSAGTLDLTGGSIVGGGFTLTVPATGTAALLGAANIFTSNMRIDGFVGFGVTPITSAELYVVPSGTAVMGLRINGPSGMATQALRVDYNSIEYLRYDARSSVSSFAMRPVDIGNNTVGPLFQISRNTNAAVGTVGPAPGCLSLVSAAGTSYFLWVDATGKLRIHTSQPTGSSGAPTVDITAGTVVGTQT